MSKEIIEQLKVNRVPYFMWTDEEKAVADKIPRKWWLGLDPIDAGDKFAPITAPYGGSRPLGDDQIKIYIYRLKPEYQPEPEPESPWIEYEVKVRSGGIYYFEPEGDSRCEFACGMSLVGFGGVKYEDCECGRLKHFEADETFHMAPIEGCPKHGPFKPVKVQFWRSKK